MKVTLVGDYGNTNTLKCPMCSSDNMHMGEIKIFDAEDSATKYPTHRGHGILLQMACELCGPIADTYLAVYFHKGSTFLEWWVDKDSGILSSDRDNDIKMTLDRLGTRTTRASVEEYCKRNKVAYDLLVKAWVDAGLVQKEGEKLLLVHTTPLVDLLAEMYAGTDIARLLKNS